LASKLRGIKATLEEAMRRAVRPLMILAMALAAAPAMAGELWVGLDRARILSFEQDIATVHVVNPGIADVTVQDSRTVIVLGRAYGSTSLLIYGRDGALLTDRVVTVQGPHHRHVTLHRGVARETYACAPDCRRALVPGDDDESFGTLASQFKEKQAQTERR
jgi:Flp pilus assembly secretin CpaC